MRKTSLVNIGFGNTISSSRLICIVSPESAPIRRVIQEAKEKFLLIDATCGKKTKSVLIMDTGHVILSGLQCETLVNRFDKVTSSGENNE